MEVVIIFIYLEFSIYFLIKYEINKKRGIPTSIELNWVMIFLSFSFAWIFYLFADYYYINQNMLLILGYLSISIGGSIFSYRIESNKIINSKYIFTIFALSVPGILFLTFLINPSLLQSIAALLVIPAYVILLLYFSKIIKRIWTSYKKGSIGLFLSIFFWLIGFALTSDFALDLAGNLLIRVIGNSLMMIGIAFLGYFLNIIPSFDEIGWREKIKYVIIILTKAGKTLYNENFMENKEVSENLIGGYISVIKSFIEESMKENSKIQSISKETETLLIEQGNLVTAAFIVDQELKIFKYNLKKLIYRFEELFNDILKDWNGDIQFFSSTKNLMKEIIPNIIY